MNKIIRELVVLLWKTLKVVLWKWLRPMFGRIMLWGFLFAGLILLVVVVIATR